MNLPVVATLAAAAVPVLGGLAASSLLAASSRRLLRPRPRLDRRVSMADERTAGAAPGPRIIGCRGDRPAARSSRHGRGFTLIEMLCTVTVAGLLSSVAYPTYLGTVTKTRRADALAATMAIQAAQERYRSGSVAYGSLSEIGASARSPAGHYQLSVVTPSATGYTLVAAASGSQASDSGCRYLKMTADGANLSYSSGANESAANDATANRRCWNL